MESNPILEPEELMHSHSHVNEDGENVFEFDLPVIHQIISHTEKRHSVLAKLLDVYEDEKLRKVFFTVASLVDPMTQPMESDNNVASIETLSNLIISLTFDSKSIIADFELSSHLFKIISSTLKLLNCDDEVRLRSLNNSDLKVDWKLRLNMWTPHNLNNQDLRLIYLINVVSIFTIYRLYHFNEPDLCLNPFLGFFLKLWKIFTNVVLLGLEIDRRVEQVPNQTTPNIVKQVVRGSTSVRYVLASILNDDIKNRYHDFNHLNIVDFMSPYGRRNGTGGLYADVRWYVGAMLALGSELNEVVETLVDLEPNDRYDEDVRYMFDYEYDDFHHQFLYPEEYDSDGNLLKNEPIVYEDEEGNFHKVIESRCTCQFFDDEIDDELIEDPVADFDDEDDDDDDEKIGIPTAVRSNDQDIEFDEMGRDWRDVPREGNIFFNSKAQLQAKDGFNWNELSSKFDDMANVQVSDIVAQRVINTIGRSVKVEFEEGLLNKEEDNKPKDSKVVTPDKIYEKWSSNQLFEKMLSLNPELCSCMLDEMFMANGYRRVLIWFITHMALSFGLINYIFELLTGLRGESKERRQKFIFSRQGPLVLSEIEKSMLLHEFLNNCLIFVSKNYEQFINSGHQTNASEFEKCVKIVKIICLMINKLLDDGKIEIEEYKVELTSLLINWIGLVKEAKELFFKINNKEDGQSDSEIQASAASEEFPPNLEKQEVTKTNEQLLSSFKKPLILQKADKRHKIFNKELKIALGNVIKKLDSGALLFRPFFELIDQDNNTSNKAGAELLTAEDKITEADEAAPIQAQFNYIKGSMKPLKHDEFYEHEQVEISYFDD